MTRTNLGVPLFPGSRQIPPPPAGSLEELATSAASIPDEPRMLCLEGIPAERLPLMQDNFHDFIPVIEQLLREAVVLLGSIDDFYDPKFSKTSGWRKWGTKSYSGVYQTGGDVSINVDLITKKLKAKGQAKAEPWVCRRTYHKDLAADGTASWAEFYTYMKREHVETEKAMTSTVLAATTAFTWNLAPTMPAPENLGRPGSQWSDFTLALVEMEHEVGWPMSHRVFPVLQLTCQNTPANGNPEFYVISAPISDWSGMLPLANYNKLVDKKNAVESSYASVEVFRRLPVSQGHDAAGTSRSLGRELIRKGSKVKQRVMPRTLSKRGQSSSTVAAGAGPADSAVAGEAPASSAAAGAPAAGAPAADAPVADAPVADPPATGPPAAATPAADANPADGDTVAEWRIEWTMATTSHARGLVPLAIQGPVIPHKIAADVPMFTKWVADKRRAGAVLNDVGNLLQADPNPPASNTAAGSVSEDEEAVSAHQA